MLNHYCTGEIPIKTGIGDKAINLFKTNLVTEEQDLLFSEKIKQVNALLAIIVSDVQLLICDQGKEYVSNDLIGRKVQIQYVRGEYTINLSEESWGIKKLTYIVFYLRRLVEQPQSCVCVDDIDVNLSCHLFRQVMGIICSRAKGQLLFTVHALNVLDVLCGDRGGRNIVSTHLREPDGFSEDKRERYDFEKALREGVAEIKDMGEGKSPKVNWKDSYRQLKEELDEPQGLKK